MPLVRTNPDGSVSTSTKIAVVLILIAAVSRAIVAYMRYGPHTVTSVVDPDHPAPAFQQGVSPSATPHFFTPPPDDAAPPAGATTPPPPVEALQPAPAAPEPVALAAATPPPPPAPDQADGLPVIAATPAPVTVPIPANPTPDSIADAITRFAHPDGPTRLHSVTWLAKQTPSAAGRPAVVPALITLLDDPRVSTRTAAATALQSWADPSTDQAIIAKLPDSAGETRRTLLDLAAKLKTPALAQAVAALIPDAKSRPAARRALIAMGPVAEKPVDDLLASDDPAVRHETCTILASIGTKASIPLLKPHAHVLEKDPGVQNAAGLAIETIQSRSK
jgi:hypothetical protein